MPVYEYKGQRYESAETDPYLAREKIIAYLKAQEQPAPAQAPAPAPEEKPSFGRQLLSGEGPDLPKVGATGSVLEGTKLTPQELQQPATGPSLQDAIANIREREAAGVLPSAPKAEQTFAPIEEFFEKGVPTGVTGLKSIKEGVGLARDVGAITSAQSALETYAAIDEGKITTPAEAARAGLSSQSAMKYLQASPEVREQMKQNFVGQISQRQDFIKESLRLFQEYAKEAEKTKGRVPDLTDIETARDFGNWLAFNMGSGAVQLAPVMLAALTTGGAGAMAVGTTMAMGETVGNRLQYIQNQVKDLAPEEQAQAIEDYIRSTQDTNVAVGLAVGALDLAGPVGSILRARAGKEGVKYFTKKEAATAAAKEIPRATGEEFLTGLGQEAIQMGGEKYLGEMQGDFATKENFKRLLNAAAAEAAGGTFGGVANVPLAVAQASRNKAIEDMVNEMEEGQAGKMLRDAGFTMERPEVKTAEDQFVDDVLGTTEAEDKKSLTQFLSQTYKDFSEGFNKLTGRAPTEDLDPSEMSFEQLVSRYEAEGMNRDSAILLANQTMQEAGNVDNGPDTRTSQPGVSVSGESRGTPAGAPGAVGTAVGRDSTVTTPVGGGTQAQPSALEGVPASIFQMYKKVRDANAALEAESNATTKRNSTTATRKYFDAVNKLIADQGVTGTEAAQLFSKLTSDISNEYDRKVAAGEDISAPVTKGKRGRKALPPEQKAISEQRQKQMAGASRDATRNAEKSAGVLAKDFDPGVYATEAEAMDAARTLLNDQREAIDTLYDIANNPAHRNNKAGKIAKEALANVPESELALAKDRAKAKQTVAKSTVKAEQQARLAESTDGQDNIVYTEFDTAQQALNWISRKGNAFEKLLAKRLMPFLKGVKIVVIDDPSDMPDAFRREQFKGAAGLYFESTKERVIYLSSDGGINNTTFLHEALHGATIARINEYLKALKDGKTIDQALGKAVSDMVDIMNQSYGYLGILKAGVKKGIITNPGQVQIIANMKEFEAAGAFDNVKEFVAYGMTHPAFQEFLHLVPGRVAGSATTTLDKKNGLTRFVQGIRAFFGMGANTNSAMQDLIIVSDRVLRAPMPVAVDEMAGKPEAARAKKQKADKELRKIQLSELADEVDGPLGDLIRMRSWSDVKEVFKTSYDTLNSKSIQVLLPTLTTMQIIDWISDRVPNLTAVVRATEKMSVMRQKMLARVEELSKPWVDFARTYVEGGKKLAALMHYSTLSEVDPTLEATVDEAINNDKELADLRAEMNKAPVSKHPSIKGQMTKREAKIRQTYKMWNELTKYGKRDSKSGLFPGQKIYRDVKRYYQNTFDLHRAILDDRIAALKLPGDINDATTPKGKLMSAIRATYEGKKQIGVYFPLMRYGNFWVSFGQGQGREFYMFESEYQRNSFIKRRMKQLRDAGDLRNESTMREDGDLDSGNDLTALREKASGASEMLTEIFTLIDSQQGVLDKDTLKDSVYQMYLLTMPEQNFRSQFIHRKGTAGFSGDALRNFVRSGYTSSGQLSTLKYSPEIFNAIDAADDALKNNPDKERLTNFTREIRRRIMDEVNPTIEDQLGQRFANGVGQAVFLWFLTSIKSALVNFTAIPIFGFPVLASRYGKVQAAAKLATYSKIWNHTTFVKTDAQGNMSYTPLSIGFSKHVRENPILAAAFTEASERGVTEITRTYDLISMAKTPSTKFTGRTSRFVRGGINMMGALFHHSERINREIMFMTTFELAYDKAVKSGLQSGKDNAAFQKAVDEAVAATYDSMFNYTKFNRPRIMRPWGARIIFQFKMFPQQVTAYFVRNFYTMWRSGYDTYKNITAETVAKEMLSAIPASQRPAMMQNPQFMATAEQEAAKRRKEALADLNESATQFFGSLLMVGMFAGVTGMPLYSATLGVIQGLLNALRDEDEPVPIDERDLDYWFRYIFLPKYFGDDMARIIAKGPISALSNIDISSSTSMDNLWFRDTQDDKSLLTDFRNQIIGALGPSAGLVENVIKAVEDWKNGHTSQAVEKVLPALFKGMVTQNRWGEEGVATKSQKAVIMDPEEVTTAMRFWKAIGFNPTELSIQQDKNFKVIEQIKKTNQERDDIMRKIKTRALNGNYASLDEQIERFIKLAIANPDLELDPDSIYTAIENAEKARAEAINGVVVTNEKLRARAAYLLGQLPKK